MHDTIAEPQQQATGDRREKQDAACRARTEQAHERGGGQADKADETDGGSNAGAEGYGKACNGNARADERHTQRARTAVAEAEQGQRTQKKHGDDKTEQQLQAECHRRRPVLLAERTAIPGDERHQIFALRQGHRC